MNTYIVKMTLDFPESTSKFNLDLALLKQQRNYLLEQLDKGNLSQCDAVIGLLNFLDALLDAHWQGTHWQGTKLPSEEL